MLTVMRLGIVRNVRLDFSVSRLYVSEIREEENHLAFLIGRDSAAKQSRDDEESGAKGQILDLLRDLLSSAETAAITSRSETRLIVSSAWHNGVEVWSSGPDGFVQADELFEY